MAQHRLAGQQVEQLTRHEGPEADDLTRAHMNPFAVGAGQADHTVEFGIAPQVARDLRFLPPHHIGRRKLADAGQDAHIQPPVPHRGPLRLCQCERRARDRNIGCFAPALFRAHHATGDDRQTLRTEPRAQQIQQGWLKPIGVEAVHPRRCARRRQNLTPRAHDPGAQVRGAPVHRHPCRFTVTHPVTTTPPSTTIDCPVIIRLAPEERNSVAATMSCGAR